MKTKTIGGLVDEAISLCREQGFADSSIRSKNKVFKAIIRKHRESGCDTFDAKLLAEYTLSRKTVTTMAG